MSNPEGAMSTPQGAEDWKPKDATEDIEEAQERAYAEAPFEEENKSNPPKSELSRASISREYRKLEASEGAALRLKAIKELEKEIAEKQAQLDELKKQQPSNKAT